MMVYFPFFQCSFLPRFSIKIRTKYFNDNGSSQNVCILFLFVLTRYQKKVIGHFQKVYIPYHGRFLYFNPPPPPHPPCFWNFQNGLSLHALQEFEIETTVRWNCISKRHGFLQITPKHQDCSVFTLFLTIKTSSQNILVTLP